MIRVKKYSRLAFLERFPAVLASVRFIAIMYPRVYLQLRLRRKFTPATLHGTACTLAQMYDIVMTFQMMRIAKLFRAHLALVWLLARMGELMEFQFATIDVSFRTVIATKFARRMPFHVMFK